MNAVEVTDEVTPEVFTPSKRKNPFGITAEPGSKLYHRQYTRAWLQQKRDEKKFQSRTLAHAVRQPRMGAHMTLRELSEAQGWSTDHNSLSSLRKRLEARQKLVGVALLFKLSPRPAGRLYTTLPLLRRYASELFDEASEQAEIIKALMATVEQRLTDMGVTVKRLQRRIRELERLSAGRSADHGSAAA